MLHSRNRRWAYRTRSRPYKLQKHPAYSDDSSLLDILNRNFTYRTIAQLVGLALVKRIVEVHGGWICVESEGQGKGSTFCFTLPQNVFWREGEGGKLRVRKSTL